MRRPRKGFWVFLPLALFAWFAPASANAATYTVTGAQDWNFSIDSPILFTARTYAWQYGIDSMLYLYNEQNNIIAANDDWYGLDSNISIELQPGSYRLRTTVCCGNPDAWYGTSYVLEVNADPVAATTTTESSTTTTTELPTTTTVEETSTSSAPSTSVLPSTTETPTTTLPQESSTTSSTIPPVESSIAPSPSETSSTSSTVPATSTSAAPPILEPLLPPPDTTEVPTTTTSSVPPSTTTTSVARTTTTPLATTTTVPPTTTELPTTTVLTETSVPEPTQEAGQEATPETAPGIISFAPSAEASEEEKEEFESQVDIFSGDFDDYVPSGSSITVSQRRVIVGATVILFVVPLPVPAPVTPSTTSSASESTGRKEQD